MSLVRKKESEYPPIVRKVLDAFTWPDSKTIVVGSASIRAIKYPSDYDVMNINNISGAAKVTALRNTIRELEKIPELLFGDIKCGEILRKKVLPAGIYVDRDGIHGWPSNMKMRFRAHNITQVPPLTVKSLAEMIDKYKDHIVRWTPNEILRGENHDGIRLADAVDIGTTKVDIYIPVNGVYTAMECIYSQPPKNYLRDVISSQYLNAAKGNYYKALKRIAARAIYTGKAGKYQPLIRIFNTSIGELNKLKNDLAVLLELIKYNRGDNSASNEKLLQEAIGAVDAKIQASAKKIYEKYKDA